MSTQNKICYIILCLIAASCKSLHSNISFEELMQQRSIEAKNFEQNSELKECGLNSRITSDNFFIQNNMWGLSKLKGKSAELCSYRNDLEVGWKWQVPNNAKGVIGYPAIVLGNGWTANKKYNGFPIQLDSIQQLDANYDVDLYVKHKKYNLAFDLWVSESFVSNRSTITTEIMIWEDWFDFSSFGKRVTELDTPFGVYEVYEGYLENKEFLQDWKYFAFVRKEKRNSGFVDIQYFLNYLQEQYGLDAQSYITSLEFGTELGNSSGFIHIKEYEVNLNNNKLGIQ